MFGVVKQLAPGHRANKWNLDLNRDPVIPEPTTYNWNVSVIYLSAENSQFLLDTPTEG